jgi:hypothetical protein
MSAEVEERLGEVHQIHAHDVTLILSRHRALAGGYDAYRQRIADGKAGKPYRINRPGASEAD